MVVVAHRFSAETLAGLVFDGLATIVTAGGQSKDKQLLNRPAIAKALGLARASVCWVLEFGH